MSELLVKRESLVAVADSIRTKTGSTDELVFPQGFVEAVQGITTSGNSPEAELALTLWEEKVHASSFYYMFAYCTSLTTVPLFDTSNVTAMVGMFEGCSSLTTVPLFDTSNVTTMSSMFEGCSSLTTVPLFDTSKVTHMTYGFRGCTSLSTVPLFDTSKLTSMDGMFEDCTSLATVPLFDTSNVTVMRYGFRGCSSLTTVPLFDTSKVTNMSNMFDSCTSLTTVPSFDMRNVTSMSKIFNRCYALTNCYFRNIKTDLQVGFSTSYGHLLTVESLLHLIKECRDTGLIKTLTIGTANLEKLANTYVRVIDITDEMRAEDDLIDEKLPFEVCESTDEGAMLITDYVLEKNWQLK